MRFLVRSAIVASLLEWTVRSSGDHGIADGVHVLIGAHVPHLHRLVQPRGQDLEAFDKFSINFGDDQ